MAINRSFAQKDTLFLAGAGADFGDSIVLRWNGADLNSFLMLQESEIIIERNDGAGTTFEIIHKILPEKLEERAIQNQDSALRMAAGILYQINQTLKSPTNDIFKAIAQKEDATFLWANLSLMADLNRSVADFMNLRFVDSKPPQDRSSLIYRVYMRNGKVTSDTLMCFMYGAIEKPLSPGNLVSTENERMIQISWQGEKKYSGYFIERSPSGKNQFVSLNTHPIVVPAIQNSNAELFWKDSVDNYTPFDYRLYGIDMFGQKSLYSPLLQAMARDRTPPLFPTGFKVTENKDRTLKLTWNPIAKGKDISGIAIGKKHLRDVQYEPLHKKLLPTSQTTFMVAFDSAQTDYYFILQVFDTAGNSSYTEAYYQLEDNTPPAQPKIISAMVDTIGIVTLKWAWNHEPDLDGYLIYYSNDSAKEFSGIVNKPLFDTIYRDTLSLKMLNREMFYCIQAVDQRFNRSMISEKIKVLRPDKLNPEPPLFAKYQVSDTLILLHFIASPSKDVKSHYLSRKDLSNGKIEILKFPENKIYKDQKFENDKDYEYRIWAIDSSGNQSSIEGPLTLHTPKSYFRPAVKIISATYDSLCQCVHLNWKHEHKDVLRTVIYRGQSPDMIAPLSLNNSIIQSNYDDKGVKKDYVYYYGIKLYFKDKTQTRISIPLRVETYYRP